eukprot:2702713-Pyramimonas_sp.AAC.1
MARSFRHQLQDMLGAFQKQSKCRARREVGHWAGDPERRKTRNAASQKPKGSGRGAGRGRAGGFLA